MLQFQVSSCTYMTSKYFGNETTEDHKMSTALEHVTHSSVHSHHTRLIVLFSLFNVTHSLHQRLRIANEMLDVMANGFYRLPKLHHRGLFNSRQFSDL